MPQQLSFPADPATSTPLHQPLLTNKPACINQHIDVQVRELIGLSGRTGKPLQRFYPQCQRCSIKQATAMRSGKRVLVLHLHAPRYRSEHLAGAPQQAEDMQDIAAVAL